MLQNDYRTPMIKLKDLIEITDIPKTPFPPSKYSDEWTDDDDMNMNEEEWEEFQNELNTWLENNRINTLTNELIDTTDLIIDFLLMDEKDRDGISNMNDKERTNISKILHRKRLQGKTSGMWKDVGIKYLGDNQLWDKMLDWEKQYYKDNHRTMNEDENSIRNNEN